MYFYYQWHWFLWFSEVSRVILNFEKVNKTVSIQRFASYNHFKPTSWTWPVQQNHQQAVRFGGCDKISKATWESLWAAAAPGWFRTSKVHTSFLGHRACASLLSPAEEISPQERRELVSIATCCKQPRKSAIYLRLDAEWWWCCGHEADSNSRNLSNRAWFFVKLRARLLAANAAIINLSSALPFGEDISATGWFMEVLARFITSRHWDWVLEGVWKWSSLG